MDFFSSLNALAGLIGAALRMLGRLRATYDRQKGIPKVIDELIREIGHLKHVIHIVQDEESLQTANIAIEVEKLKKVEATLIEWLKKIDPGSRGPVTRFTHILVNGSKEEENLSSLLKQLSDLKSSLCLHIQLSAVGVIKDVENKLVANLTIINKINETLVTILGRKGGLRIAQMLEGRPPRDDGMVLLSAEDLAALSLQPSYPGTEDTQSRRIVVGNLSMNQAIQVNGPIGEDIWKDVAHLEIRDNRAEHISVQVNHAMSMETMKFIMDRQDERMERNLIHGGTQRE